MPRMSDLIGLGLQWTQPSARKQEFELLVGDISVCRLDFAGSFKSIASATNIEGTWVFDRPGFWQRRTVVRSESGTDELAVFQNHTWKNGGTLTLADGRVFQVTTNFWASQFHILDDAGGEVIYYSRIGGFFHESCDVEIYPYARDLAELSWLVPFGWYLILMMKRDSAAVAAAT